MIMRNARTLLSARIIGLSKVEVPRSFSKKNFFNSTSIVERDSDQKTVLVLGSSGVLGSAISRHLGKDLSMKVIGADVVERNDDKDWQMDGFVAMPNGGDLAELTTCLTMGVDSMLGDGDVLDAIVCASGGWQGNPKQPQYNASNDEVESGAVEYAKSVESMLYMNLYPVVAAGYVAERYMAEEGLFVAMGATAALSPTPGMFGYGLSKSAAHHYVQTVGASTGKGAMHKKKRQEGRQARRLVQSFDSLTAIGILPTMIDTPSNRSAEPNDDFRKWTKPIDIAKQIGYYVEKPILRPHSGSLIKVFPRRDGAEFQLVR